MKKKSFGLILIICFAAYSPFCQQPFKVNINKSTGDYILASADQVFKGSVHHTLGNVKISEGFDLIGVFNKTSFEWKDSVEYKADIKCYKKFSVVLFSLTLPNGDATMPQAFPSFTSFPKYNHTFSFYDDNFAPPQFKLNETSTPWLFFDDNYNSFIISPASDFIVSKMYGDGINNISSGLNNEIKNLSAGFTHSTILVMNNGIQSSWDEWGNVLRKLYKRIRPENDADVLLNYFGYWTDNGADYYYNYDTTIGYAPTLVSLQKRYKDENIPLGYMQLDSWWYEKSIYDCDGKPVADHKNKSLPYGKWNRYGGLLSYTPDSFLFPKGLHSFQQQLGIPLATHNRWIDPHSDYNNHYKIIGFAAVDSAYWNHILQPIAKAGVVCYEQDWLNYIYTRTPQMPEDVSVGNAFTDAMSNACKKANMNMQYCMAMPRHFLQGVKYNNLTTIRTSGDRFEPSKWEPFLYTSQLAYEIGAWPWCDVFKSDEKGNMILSILSAGAVGTGDAIGKENKQNILSACRNDGVLVKPDAPMLPVDKDYLYESNNIDSPFLAYTFTRHNTITTGYLFAFAKSLQNERHIDFVPSSVGMKGEFVAFDPSSQKVILLNSDDHFKDELPDDLYKYYIFAPLNNGIAFFGDEEKIAATGKKRITNISSDKNGLTITVLFAKNETSVMLQGYSEKPVAADKGIVHYNDSTHLFTIKLESANMQKIILHINQKA